ncbi:MAG: hypothetical protein FWH41_07755 [Treponema sp.]|nr:hypothetical protein [Treponema sp.]
MKKNIFSVFFLFFFLMTVMQVSAQQKKPFKWSMAFQNVKTQEMMPVTKPVNAQTGEQFRLFICPAETIFCYVIAESSNGSDLSVIYADSLKSKDIWDFEIQLSLPRGSESLWVIASRDKLPSLDQKIAAMEPDPGSSQRRALMNEIFSLRSQVSKFKETPEKPVLMGGASRGSAKFDGWEFSGLDTYVKEIAIFH